LRCSPPEARSPCDLTAIDKKIKAVNVQLAELVAATG
jgi:hypothetical protein